VGVEDADPAFTYPEGRGGDHRCSEGELFNNKNS
jgi:hypothetical protein